MPAIAPVPVTALPTPAPQTNDPANFATRGDLLLAALPANTTQMNALADNVFNNATDAFNSSGVAQVAANFKGSWASLTGALNVPATVYHNASFWVLLSNLANVTTATPGVSGSWVAATAMFSALGALTSVNGGPLAGNRNLEINGNCRVAQRGNVAYNTGSLNTGVYGGADRHLALLLAFSTVAGTIQRFTAQSTASGYAQGIEMTTTGTGSVEFSHRIEARNSAALNGKQVTVSRRVFQNTGASVNCFCSLHKPAATEDVFGALTTLATGSAVAVPSGVWTTVSLTYTLGAAEATLGLQAKLTFSSVPAATAKRFMFGDAQTEIGGVVTPIEQVPMAVDDMNCRRYFEYAGIVFLTTVVANFQTAYWKTAKRASPTLVITTNGGSGATVVALANDLTGGFYQNAANTIDANGQVSGDAEL